MIRLVLVAISLVLFAACAKPKLPALAMDDQAIARAKTLAPIGMTCAPIKSWYEDSHAINGQPRNMGSEPHNGFDMAAPIGTSVIAAAPGVVVLSNYQPTSGSVIWIDHGLDIDGNHIYSFSAHLSLRLVLKGDLVRRGDVIGKSGDSGAGVGKEGPHLHFGISMRSAEQVRVEEPSSELESIQNSEAVSPNFFLYPIGAAKKVRSVPTHFPKWQPDHDYGDADWVQQKLFMGLTFPMRCDPK